MKYRKIEQFKKRLESKGLGFARGRLFTKGNHLTLGTSGLPLPQTHSQNQSNNKKNVEHSVNSNSLFSRVQNHDNFPFFANITAKTSPIMAGGKLIVNNNNNLPSVKSGAKNTAPNHPAERFANQPDSTSNRSLSNNQDFIEQINPNISTSDFQYFQDE